MDYVITFLICVPGAALAIAAHEYVKALASTAFGDELPRKEGRLTVNPLRHIDPLGFIFMLIFQLGWGKPVNTSALHYRDRRKNTVVVYVLPIIANVLIATAFVCISGLIKNIETAHGTAQYYIKEIIKVCALINMNYAIFNILPVYPLSGAKILTAFLPPAGAIKYANYEKVLQIALVVLIILGFINQFFVGPVATSYLNGFYNLFS